MSENKSCDKSCSPSDWKKGGKCDINGCYEESAAQPEEGEKEDDYPGKWYQPLFDIMRREHDKTLIQSEMDDIISVVQKMLNSDIEDERSVATTDQSGNESGETKLGEAIKDFNKAVNCLALELPEAVWNDVHFKWVKLQNEIKAIAGPPKNNSEVYGAAIGYANSSPTSQMTIHDREVAAFKAGVEWLEKITPDTK